jgi:hypothetical protein
MTDIHQQIVILKARIAQRRARREAVADLEARLVRLMAKQIRKEHRDDKRKARAA